MGAADAEVCEDDLDCDRADEVMEPDDALDFDEADRDEDPEDEAVSDTLGIVEGFVWLLGLVLLASEASLSLASLADGEFEGSSSSSSESFLTSSASLAASARSETLNEISMKEYFIKGYTYQISCCLRYCSRGSGINSSVRRSGCSTQTTK